MNRLFQRGKLVGDRTDISATPKFFRNQLPPAAMIFRRFNLGIDRLPEEYTQPWLNVLANHSRWLGTVVYARLRDHHAVDEVMQETALAAAKNQRPLDDEGMSKWLYRVAVRQSLLYRRRVGRQTHKLDRLAESQPISSRLDDSRAPYRLVIASEQQDLVRSALQKLGRGDCEILLLKYTENWSCRELAVRLGVSEAAIKSRLLRARNCLREELLRLNQNWELP